MLGQPAEHTWLAARTYQECSDCFGFRLCCCFTMGQFITSVFNSTISQPFKRRFEGGWVAVATGDKRDEQRPIVIRVAVIAAKCMERRAECQAYLRHHITRWMVIVDPAPQFKL